METYRLPTAPPSAPDRPSFSSTTQAEALRPDVLAAMVREATDARCDMTALRQAIVDQLNDLRGDRS